ncbi:hypothetical protein EVAR_17014_1 [Eumeta japonica]|uniref:Uncharacterized protein n=1 Tax=Eumeta variegata TaxID=151549 RepID=A0A4C1TVM9_EUMVA|nr:hypothetical protein EVAR_17014_1 [Eumeta japonica]
MSRPTKRAALRSHIYCKPLRSSTDHHIRLRQLLDHNDVTIEIYRPYPEPAATAGVMSYARAARRGPLAAPPPPGRSPRAARRRGRSPQAARRGPLAAGRSPRAARHGRSPGAARRRPLAAGRSPQAARRRPLAAGRSPLRRGPGDRARDEVV